MNNSADKRVAIVSLTDGFGGAEFLMSQLNNHLAPTSHLIYLAKVTKSKNTINRTYLYESANLKLGFIKLLLSCKKLNEFDIIFSSHIYLNAVLGLLKKLRFIKKDVVLVFRESTSIFLRESGLRLQLYKLAYKVGYGSQKLIISQSDIMKRQLIKNLKASSDWTILSIPNPVNLNLIQKKSLEPLEESQDYIVSAGRLIPEKGFDNLIRAFNLAKDQLKTKRLIIIGDGPEKLDLQNLVKSLNLNSMVDLIGFKDNPFNYFKNAKLCVVSSRIEGFPNVLLQMMSTNGRVVSTLCAGNIETIRGLIICPPDNVEQLALSITEGEKIESQRSVFDIDLNSRSFNRYWERILTSIAVK